jgi:hypothetical protein
MRREDAARDTLPVSRDGERALQAARRAEHGAEDGGRNRANPAGAVQAWVLEVGESGASVYENLATPGVVRSPDLLVADKLFFSPRPDTSLTYTGFPKRGS